MEKIKDSARDTIQNLSSQQPLEWRLLQPIWEMRKGYEEYLKSPLFPIVLSVSFYFVSMLPFMVFDLYGKDWKWIQKYKIQPNKEVTWPQVKRAISLTVWNHLVFILPISIAQWIWTPPTELLELAPTVTELVLHMFLSLVVFDFQYWAWHAIHHKIRFLYRHVHALHHEYMSPSSWVTQYLHPWELISVGVFTTTSPWIFKAHPLTQWAFYIFSISISVEAHIGYDFPLAPHHWLPMWGGCPKHDMHHQRPLTNFEPFFKWWDYLFGWECPGQLAGGYRPPALIEYDQKVKEKRELAKKKRQEAKIKANKAQ